MPGSDVVNANLALWLTGIHKQLEAEMDRHIKDSVSFAQREHRWDDITGQATQAIQSYTQSSPAAIESTIYGGVEHNLYLERAWFFEGRYKIIEAARNHNLAWLWTRIAMILAGRGFGFRFGK